MECLSISHKPHKRAPMLLSAVFGSATVHWSSSGHTHVIPEETQCKLNNAEKHSKPCKNDDCITLQLPPCNEPQPPMQFQQDMDSLLHCTTNAEPKVHYTHPLFVFTPPPSPSSCASPPPPPHPLKPTTITRPRQAPRRALYTPANSDDDIPEICPATLHGNSKLQPNMTSQTQQDSSELEYVLDCGCATLTCSTNDPPIKSTQCFGSFVKTFYATPLVDLDGIEYSFLFHCLLCEYVTSRKYRADRHKEGVHKHNGQAMKRKRLFQEQNLANNKSKRRQKRSETIPQ